MGHIHIRELTDPGEKQEAVRTILEDLPEWFGIPQAQEEYIQDSASQTCFAAFPAENRLAGVLCLSETGKDTVQIAVMGVLKQYHRQGIGRQLCEQAQQWAARKGYSFLQVKTVEQGKYQAYDKTNLFYQSLGFKDFEVFRNLWSPENPCQVYVMSLKK